MKKWVLFSLVLVVLCGTGFSPAFAELNSASSQEVSQADPTEIQKALTEAGFYKGTIDGIIGKKTRAAIRAFQEKHDLTADGVCGPKTWEKLKAYMEEAQEIDAAEEGADRKSTRLNSRH